MGTSFVTADGEHGFWMRDGILELWLRLLTLHIPEPTGADTKATHQATRQIRDQWLLASKGFFGGCVPVDLEKAVSSTEGKAIVIAAIRSLREVLTRQPATIDKDALNLLGFEGNTWVEHFETCRLTDVADAFLELLEGRIMDTARSTAFMPGRLPPRP